MTSTQVIGLGVRLFAVWLFVYVLRNVPAMWNFNAGESDPAANAAVAVVAAILLVIIAILWFFPITVAGRLLPRTRSEDRLSLPLEQVESVGFCLVGLWIFATAVPGVFYWILMTYHAQKPGGLLSFYPQDIASMTGAAVQLVLGIWLLFGAKGLRGLLRWARSSGS